MKTVDVVVDDKAEISGKAADSFSHGVLVQIYEIQTPGEAEAMIELGVNRLGSVLLSADSWKNRDIRKAIRICENTGVKNSMIPLFDDADAVFRSADYYAPDILHFCETLTDAENHHTSDRIGRIMSLQEGFRRRFPEIIIMRTIPVAPRGKGRHIPSLEWMRMFEPVSDCFLIDTFRLPDNETTSAVQPENGFVGITGETCDWEKAAELAKESRIPVILAGGISPENVYEAVMSVQPAGVDSCTRTNAFDVRGNVIRFKKDPEKVRHLVSEVRRAVQEMPTRNTI
ncbi:MAG: hypothetical protein R6U50_06635 [Desulfobacterales bacterium]